MVRVTRALRVYLLPGAVLQSVMIGGGYGTGREIVEYFSRYGLAGGMLGLGLATLCFAIVLAVSYEFARIFQVYDYRRFFRVLLGRGWIVFELLYLAMFALVLAVIAAASGKLVEEHLHLPGTAGLTVLLVLITLLAFYGRQWVTNILAFKAAILSVVFLVYFLIVVSTSAKHITAEFARHEIGAGWAVGALRYGLYSSVVIPAMLFATTAIKTRREAICSGVTSAVMGIIPGVLLHISFGAAYPEVLNQPIPAYWMITHLDLPALTAAYIVVLFGSLLDSGLCFIQSVNERLDGWSLERRGTKNSRPARAATAIVCVAVSGSLSLIGIVGLISQGYGTMAWGFLVLFVVPILTIGIHRIARHDGNSQIVAALRAQHAVTPQ